MKRMAWELSRGWWRLGRIGAMGGILLLATAVIVLTEHLPLQRDLQSRRIGLAERERVLRRLPPPAPDRAPHEERAQYRFAQFLHHFHDIAARHGLAIAQVDYKPQAIDDTRAAPVHGYLIDTSFGSSYPQLRRFLLDLRSFPGVRVERLSVVRPDIGKTSLEVQVQWSYRVEAAP